MSADDRFDELGKALAESTSRRKFLKVAAAAAAGAVLSVVRAPEAAASHNRRCREPGANCSSNAECCTHFCGSDFHCACAVPCPGVTTGKPSGGVTTDCCAPGDVCCPGNGGTVPAQCIAASKTLCPSGQTFSSTTCRCEAICTRTCTEPLVLDPVTCTCVCPPAQICGTNCCDPTAGQVCCTTGPGTGQCRRPTGAPCGSNNQCCSGSCPGTGPNRVCA
jgi:hypothetical protein